MKKSDRCLLNEHVRATFFGSKCEDFWEHEWRFCTTSSCIRKTFLIIPNYIQLKIPRQIRATKLLKVFWNIFNRTEDLHIKISVQASGQLGSHALIQIRHPKLLLLTHNVSNERKGNERLARFCCSVLDIKSQKIWKEEKEEVKHF